MQQALEVIKGADGVVAQHVIEFLRNGVPLSGRYRTLSKLGRRRFPVALLPTTCFLWHKVLTSLPTPPRHPQQTDSKAK